MAVPSVEERLAPERARMRPSVDSLRERVETYARGPRSRAILLETLETESLGHLDFAMSMVTGRAEILDSMGPGGHSTTFAGYPAAAAGANKVLDIYERDDIPGRAASSGAYFLDGLLALQAAHPSVGDVQGKGLFLALELVRDRTTKVPADAETSWVHQECVNQGLICITSGYFSNRLCLAPPLVIDRSEIDRALQILDRVIGEMERKFLIPG